MEEEKFQLTHSVAVLPKKEWFIYLYKNKLMRSLKVAVLPKKEWFIYRKSFAKKQRKKSQSYPKRSGSSISQQVL